MEPIAPIRSAAGRAGVNVLLVEDDRSVRLLFASILRGGGCTVTACEDGLRAVDVIHARIDRFDAVVTDAVMPGLDGRGLIAEIRALRPELPILVISGHLPDRTGWPEDPHIVYLNKPVSPDRLRSELSRALDASGSVALG